MSELGVYNRDVDVAGPVMANRGIVYTRHGVRFPRGTLRGQSYLLSQGTLRHRQLQSQLGLFGGTPEYRVESPEYGIRGSIDILKGNFLTGYHPEEIKTVPSSYLMTMSAPKSSAISQLNYYMYATGAKSGTLRYIARENLNQQREFQVPFRPGLLIADMARIRKQQMYPWTSAYPAINPIQYHYTAIGHKPHHSKHVRFPIGPIASRINA